MRAAVRPVHNVTNSSVQFILLPIVDHQFTDVRCLMKTKQKETKLMLMLGDSG